MSSDNLPNSNSEAKQPMQESPLDEQWQSLSQDWQAQPFEKTDIQALLKRTKRRTIWAKSLLALNVLATIGMLAAFVYGLFQGEFGKAMNSFLGICGGLSVIFVIYEVKIRLATWQRCCDSPDKAIANAIAGCESSIKYIVLTKVAFLPFLILANWFFYSMAIEDQKSMWPPLIFINSYLAVCYAITEFFHRKRRNEYQQLKGLNSK